MELSTFLNGLLTGLATGGLYALIAVGYTMVYGIVKLINFAHGEVFMFGGYFAFVVMVGMAGGDAGGVCVFVGLLAAVTAWAVSDRRVGSAAVRAALAVVAGLAAAGGMALLARAGTTGAGDGTSWMLFWTAGAVSIGLCVCMGVALDRVAYRPLRNSPRLAALITAIGASVGLQSLAQVLFGSAKKSFPDELLPWFLKTGRPGDAPEGWWATVTDAGFLRVPMGGPEDLLLPVRDVVIIVTAVLSMIALHLYVTRTRTGRAMRACSEDGPTAALMGVDVDRTIRTTFVVGSALAAVGALLYVARERSLEPLSGYQIGILAFAAAVLGGIGSLPGAMIGGLLIGLAMGFAPLVPLDEWAAAVLPSGLLEALPDLALSQWNYGVAYGLMIFIIVVRPQGVLGKATAVRA